jgi:hypothetical protein
MHACVGGGAPLAAQVAGGTHHAFAGHGEGFCVFNDIAVAASTALRTYGEHVVAPILVIDLDVRPRVLRSARQCPGRPSHAQQGTVTARGGVHSGRDCQADIES